MQANGGTLFLDEIGDIPLPLQARLLRVLQERSVTPLGSQKSITVDIAVIGATHRNLREMIDAGTFREDLYYRMNGLVVRLPALRERSDLPAVAQRILASECPQGTLQISDRVMSLFQCYPWPGNVRQLANVLRTAAVMATGESQINEQHLSDDFLEDARQPERAGASEAPVLVQPGALAEPAREPREPPSADHQEPAAGPLPTRTLVEAELDMIRSVLEACDGNISEASKRLGISRNTIYRKMRWGKPEAA